MFSRTSTIIDIAVSNDKEEKREKTEKYQGLGSETQKLWYTRSKARNTKKDNI